MKKHVKIGGGGARYIILRTVSVAQRNLRLTAGSVSLYPPPAFEPLLLSSF
jgi:hypothetical protein